jgi:predicted  nucleic acid-binding Zn-ribbon protein
MARAEGETGAAVESARHDLIVLVELQNTYDRITEAIRERQTPPPEVKELQKENRRREMALILLEEKIATHTEELKEVHKKQEEGRLELEHFQKQKGMVTNEREFTAVISEIDYATKALTEATDQRTELEAAVEALNEEIEAHRKALPEDVAAHTQVAKAWEKRKKQLKRAVHKLAKEAQERESALKPKTRAQFLRLLESKRGTAISAVVDGTCSVCHFSVRPHLQQRIRRCEELIDCEYCHRILFFEDIVDHGPSEVVTSS